MAINVVKSQPSTELGVPQAMQSELQKILSAANYKRYLLALAAPLKEYKALLPDEISAQAAESFIQFVTKKYEQD